MGEIYYDWESQSAYEIGIGGAAKAVNPTQLVYQTDIGYTPYNQVVQTPSFAQLSNLPGHVGQVYDEGSGIWINVQPGRTSSPEVPDDRAYQYVSDAKALQNKIDEKSQSIPIISGIGDLFSQLGTNVDKLVTGGQNSMANIFAPLIAQLGTSATSALATGLSTALSGGGKGSIAGATVIGRTHGLLELQTASGKRIFIKTVKRRRYSRRGGGMGATFNQMLKYKMMKEMMK